MKRTSVLLYKSGYAIASYYGKYSKSDRVSLLIEVMKDIPTAEHKTLIDKLIDGWVSWIKKEISLLNIHFDIIIRALGHTELEYNSEKPMSILTSRLAKELGAEHRIDLIRKVEETSSQTTLPYNHNAWNRQKNLNGSFKLNIAERELDGKNILVLDDIKTTGSTLKHIAAALYCNGKSNLYFLTLGESASSQPLTDIELLTHLESAMGLPT